MPKYYNYKIGNYYLYYTSKCIVEAMHVHASDKKLTEAGSAKFWVKSDGSVKIQDAGRLKSHEITEIIEFIGIHYKEMYFKWRQKSKNGYYGDEMDAF